MPRIHFTEPDGTEHDVEATPGMSLMQTAVFNHVRGIIADCGGNCSCGTCHVYIDAAGAIPAPKPSERAMLGIVPDKRDVSRLSCCITITPDLDGLRVQVAKNEF
jgi:2Fe-2S ferredoxin